MEFKDVRMSVGTTVVNIVGTYENNGKLENFTVSVPKTDENIQWLSDIFAKNKNTKVEVLDANRETFHGDVPEKFPAVSIVRWSCYFPFL